MYLSICEWLAEIFSKHRKSFPIEKNAAISNHHSQDLNQFYLIFMLIHFFAFACVIKYRIRFVYILYKHVCAVLTTSIYDERNFHARLKHRLRGKPSKTKASKYSKIADMQKWRRHRPNLRHLLHLVKKQNSYWVIDGVNLRRCTKTAQTRHVCRLLYFKKQTPMHRQPYLFQISVCWSLTTDKICTNQSVVSYESKRWTL